MTQQNTVEDIHNLMLATGNDDFSSLSTGAYLAKAALDSSTDWSSFIAGSWDDAQVCPERH